MKTSKLRWTIFSFLPVCIGCSSVHTEITIPAEPEIVWSVLTDTAGYKAWNPVLISIEGELREGEKIKYG